MKLFISILLLQFSVTCFADDVTMAFGEAIPPFSFPDSDTGIEIEVISEALALHNHTLKPLYVPLARVPIAFISRDADAAMTDLGQDFGAVGAVYGDPAVTYDNVFITIKSKKRIIEKPRDLLGLTVVSFQGAIKRYPKWLDPVAKMDQYFELNNQMLQVLTLDKERYEVVLSDKSIFQYYTLQAQKESGTKLKEVQLHSFTTVNPNDYRPVFWSKQIRNDFNEGLANMKQSGRYQAIYDKYLKEK